MNYDTHSAISYVWGNEDKFDNNDKKLLANDMNHDVATAKLIYQRKKFRDD